MKVCGSFGSGGSGPDCLVDHRQLEVKYDVVDKKVNGNLGRFYIGVMGAGSKEWQFPGGKGCVLCTLRPSNCSDEGLP